MHPDRPASEDIATNEIQGDRSPLWSRGMAAVLAAQFLSAMADNALLFATLALLKAQLYPQWHTIRLDR